MPLDFHDPELLTRENIEAYSFLGREIFQRAIDEWRAEYNPTNENVEDGLPDWLLRIIVNYDGKDKADIMEVAYYELVDGSPWKYYFECENKILAQKAKAQKKKAKRGIARARRPGGRG